MFGHTKILHTLTGVGSAALVAAVLYAGEGDSNFLHGIIKFLKKIFKKKEKKRGWVGGHEYACCTGLRVNCDSRNTKLEPLPPRPAQLLAPTACGTQSPQYT